MTHKTTSRAATKRRQSDVESADSRYNRRSAGVGRSALYREMGTASLSDGEVAAGNRAVADFFGSATGALYREVPAIAPGPTGSIIVRRDYTTALERESRHAALERFARAITNRDRADAKEVRWREAQQGSARDQEKARQGEFKSQMEEDRSKYHTEFNVLSVWFLQATKGKKLTKAEFAELTSENVRKGDPIAELFVSGAMANYKAEADRQKERAGKQKTLLLGYRQLVAGKAKAQILDTNIWSWGVNQAWIEGGASVKAEFQLDTEIGDTATALLMAAAFQKNPGKQFLDAIHPEQNRFDPPESNTLWHREQNRPTWYALEIAGLLDQGYRPSPQDLGLLLLLDTASKGVSDYVQNAGVDAYLTGDL